MSGDPTVLIVDDDDAVRASLERLMRSVGLDVQTFATAGEFLEAGSFDVPGCVVLDVRMPGLGGLELQEVLNAENLAIQIVFITGHGSIPMSVRAMKGGAVDFIEKPFDDQTLLDAVHRAIAQDRRRRRERAEMSHLQGRIDSLTPRELEVLSLVVTGMLNKQIARELGTVEKTVKVHRGRVMKKMKADSLADLVRMAERMGVTGQKV